MEIERIPGTTRVLGVDQGYRPLPIRDERQEGISVMLSQWRPSAEELAKLMLGAPIYLSIMGTIHPPAQVMIGDPPLSAGKMDLEGGTAPSQETYLWRVWVINDPQRRTSVWKPTRQAAIDEAVRDIWPELTDEDVDAERP